MSVPTGMEPGRPLPGTGPSLPTVPDMDEQQNEVMDCTCIVVYVAFALVFIEVGPLLVKKQDHWTPLSKELIAPWQRPLKIAIMLSNTTYDSCCFLRVVYPLRSL